jgi:predicted nucleic acid-binding protein
MIVVDTDVLIDYLAGQEPAAGRVAVELETDSFGTTAVTRFELLAGARNRTAQDLVLRLLDAIPTLPLDRRAADRAADIQRALGRKGGGIGMADSLIAGIVLTHDAMLLTRNRKHFGRVDGLKLATLPPGEGSRS